MKATMIVEQIKAQMNAHRTRLLFGTLLAGLAFAGTPAAAQDNLDKRVERVEKQLRAVQRKVFPDGAGRFLEPEISAQTGATTTTGSTSAVTDLIARVDALESQIAQLTGTVEQNGFRLRKLEDQIAAMTSAEAGLTPFAATSIGASDAVGPATAAAVSAPAPERVEGVASIIKPVSDDAGEDAYIYGYRLWEAKYYPEAQAQLQKTVDDHPNHKRASFARNLLGRAYLDEGKPGTATRIFLENYQKLPRGERAPDSLYFLGVALTDLGEKDRACRSFEELADAYPEAASGRLNERLTSGKSKAGCR